MTRPEFLRELEKIMKAPRGSLRGDEMLVDLGAWDSLAVIGFLALADKEVGVSFPPQALENCKTPNDLYDTVLKIKSQG